jgi:hypothetical protein
MKCTKEGKLCVVFVQDLIDATIVVKEVTISVIETIVADLIIVVIE